MATYNTGSLVDGAAGDTGASSPRLNAGLSTQIIIKVNNEPVGALQTLTVTQTRGLARIKEIGTDGVIEIIPNDATTFEISAGRIVFDQLRLPEAFSRAFRFINAQRLPFDIEVVDISGLTSGADTFEGASVMVYKNCWFQTYSTPYAADNYLITETATIWCETAYVSSPADSDQLGLRAISPQTDASRIERSINHVGGNGNILSRRGSMDAAGLVNTIFGT